MIHDPAAAGTDELAQELARVTGGDEPPRSSSLARIAGLTARSARHAGTQAVASGRWLAGVAVDAAGHLPVRDLPTLQAHHHGATGAELAERLIERAALTTGAVGAAVGGLAAAEAFAPPTWSSFPVELAAETLVVVAMEMRLVAELHAVAGQPIAGTAAERATAVAKAWAERRGLSATALLTGKGVDLLGREARERMTRLVQRRLMARAGRNVTSLAPFLAGAAAGGALNRRATRHLGRAVASSLGVSVRR